MKFAIKILILIFFAFLIFWGHTNPNRKYYRGEYLLKKAEKRTILKLNKNTIYFFQQLVGELMMKGYD